MIAHGRDEARGSALVAEIAVNGGRARFVAADLTDRCEVRRLVEVVGEIDVLVNNAGFSAWAPTEKVADADHEQIEQLDTTTLLYQAAHPAEIAQVIAFLAPPRASDVTGTTVSVNGGRTAI